MVVGAAVRGADEVQLLCSWCKVVIMYEVVVSYVTMSRSLITLATLFILPSPVGKSLTKDFSYFFLHNQNELKSEVDFTLPNAPDNRPWQIKLQLADSADKVVIGARRDPPN